MNIYHNSSSRINGISQDLNFALKHLSKADTEFSIAETLWVAHKNTEGGIEQGVMRMHFGTSKAEGINLLHLAECEIAKCLSEIRKAKEAAQAEYDYQIKNLTVNA